ncbi:hypothetical protein CNR22_01635 [Sphingobacteriaceae bacterium]|nr:hypothetical protein CNR22_01635 [Sphingobacteriaceae bacterium]
MKTQSGIWIDGAKAFVITFYDGKETIREISSNVENNSHHPGHEGDKGTFMGIHHLNHEATFAHRKMRQEFQFLDEVIAEVKNVNEIFIMGPSGMKKKLQARMVADKQMQPKLTGLITTDHLTLNQCVEKVKDFYKL